MIDLEIRYPDKIDLLPLTTQVSVNIGENINALRDSILNVQNVLGLDVNIGLFTPDPTNTTVASRLNRLERGIAERNLVFRELNVSDSLSVLLNSNNMPSVKIGRGEANNTVPVTILGPLTILSSQVANPLTLIQTPVEINVTTFDQEASSATLIKGKSNFDQPLLHIEDTNNTIFLTNNPNSLALKIDGNVEITGRLQANFSISHTRLLDIETVPTDATRGSTRHVLQGDYHSHRKGRFNQTQQRWVVDSSTNPTDFGIINHRDLEGIGTLPTHGNDFTPLPQTAYHVTGGDLHSHSAGDGAQIDHNDLKNISPAFSNHITGGDSHDHQQGRGAQITHTSLSDIGTSGPNDIHVPRGGNHQHMITEDGDVVGDGGQIDHRWLSNIQTTGDGAIHVTGGDTHRHTQDLGDGGQIDHNDLLNSGTLSHEQIDQRISTFRRSRTGITSFTSSDFDAVTISHGMGSDQFKLLWSLASINSAPPSDPNDVGVIYVDSSSKNSNTVTLRRAGGALVGPAIKASIIVTSPGSDNDLQYIARTAGSVGNNIVIEYRDDPGALSIGETVKVVAVTFPASITIIFDSGSPPTAAEIRSAILSDPSASLVVDILVAEGTGDGIVADGYGPVNLSGGQDFTGFTSLDIEWVAIATN